MLDREIDIAAAAFALAIAAHAALLLSLAWRLLRRHREAASADWFFLLALGLSLGWAGLGLYAQAPAGRDYQSLWLPLLDALRYGAWFAFVLRLLRPDPSGAASGDGLGVRGLRAGAWLACLATVALQLLQEYSPYAYSLWDRPLAFAGLAQAVLGLMLVEQLLRNSRGDARWGAKPVCLALASIFVFDLYTYSLAALFSQYDGDAYDIRPAVHSMAVPLLFVALRRHKDWLSKMHVSRAAVYQSATLLIVGGYLLLVSGVGYYVRYTGGNWGRAMQIALMSVALVALVSVLFSGAMRAKLRVYINKNFFSYRYDYREEWLKFTAMLASQNSPQELGVSVIKGIANLVESPSGGLWLMRQGHGGFQQVAAWNTLPSAEIEPTESAMAAFLRSSGWIVDLDEYRRAPQRYRELQLPDWLREDARCWLLVPLLVGTELTGFVLLGPPRTRMELNWEVRDLLRTVSSQASGYLAQMQATEALLEARKFDAFNRMSAFVVHDLKNIVTQLSLMMKNARRLRDNPEFQEDMLATVENSLEKMRQLMLQLREGNTPHGSGHGVELEAIARRLAGAALSKGRELHLEIRAAASTRGHEERVERVIGHVVQNAFDATPEEGEVRLALSVEGSYAQVEVSDTGCGMSEEFVRTRLFKPFQTTKSSGMGIGAYESFQYLQELGGKIKVHSEVDRGTRITILLPLFHASKRSDLGMLGAK